MTIDIIEAAKADRLTTRRNMVWTRQADERLLAMIAAGHTSQEIADALGVVSAAAIRTRHQRLLSPEPIWRWRDMTAAEREAFIREANGKGRSQISIAKSLGCKPTTISNFISDHGIEGLFVPHCADRYRTHRFWHLSPDEPEHIEFVRRQDEAFCKRMSEVGGSFS